MKYFILANKISLLTSNALINIEANSFIFINLDFII